jgi:hypothetical protein
MRAFSKSAAKMKASGGKGREPKGKFGKFEPKRHM